MTEFLYNLVFFVIALGILVTFHEWGHFYAARKLGVKVLRFSVGFGSPLFTRLGKDGVEYVVAAIPLGGYVKMLDDRDSEVSPDEQHMAFNRQPLWKRNIIVFAGPFANFVLALLLYWLMFMSGTPVARAIVAEPPSQSIAAEAGLRSGEEIISVDGTAVVGWKETVWALVARLGERGEITMQMRQPDSDSTRKVSLNINNWLVDDREPDILGSLGLIQKTSLDPIIGGFSEDSAMLSAGAREQDRIIKINDSPIERFYDVQRIMQDYQGGEPLKITLERSQETLTLEVMPRRSESSWLLGITAQQSRAPVIMHQAGPLDSVAMAWTETLKVMGLTATMFKKLVVGEVSTKSLGGPIAIAEGAGTSASYGWVFFLSFLGMISVNLGLINLLPVPMLDGGHLLFNAVEWIKGKPLSEGAQEFGMKIGIVMVLGLMAMAIFNDIARL